MPTNTPNFALTKPDIGQENWGDLVNANFDKIDTAVTSAANTASAAQTAANTALAVATPVPPEKLNSTTTMALNFSASKQKVITLVTNVTSVTAVGMSDGDIITLVVKTGTGGFAFPLPSIFENAVAINTANGNNGANKVVIQQFRYDADLAKAHPLTLQTY